MISPWLFSTIASLHARSIMSVHAFAVALLLMAASPSQAETQPQTPPSSQIDDADASSAPAEPQSQTPPAHAEGVTDLGDVQVAGERLQEQVQSFIREATAPPRGRRLARWNRPICIGVSNMDARYAQFMIDRVTAVAQGVGIETEEPGCRPTIIVVAASDAPALAKALVDDDPLGFRPAVSATDLGKASLHQFQVTDAPVRWWHVSVPVMIDTGAIAVLLTGESQPAPLGGGPPPPLMVAVRDPTRIRANIREDLARVFIIIDVTKTGRIGFGALSDYVAMVALAQIRSDADTSQFDTVLNLFAEGADRTAGLTQWDKDYLASLYSSRVDRARSTQQRLDIVRGMTQARDPSID